MKQLIFIILMAYTFAACSDKEKDIIYLNNQLTTINDSIFYKGQQWGEEFRIAYNAGDYGQLSSARQQIESYINASIERVSKIEDVGGSEELRKAELDYLQFERDVIVGKMQAFETFSPATGADTIMAAYSGLVSSSREEQVKLNALHDLQRQYAAKNNLELKESELSHIQ